MRDAKSRRFETPRAEPEAIGLPYQHLGPGAVLSEKYENITLEWVHGQIDAYQIGQRVECLTHIDGFAAEEDPSPSKIQHWVPPRQEMTCTSTSGEKPAPIPMRMPFFSCTSMTGGDEVSGAEITPAN